MGGDAFQCTSTSSLSYYDSYSLLSGKTSAAISATTVKDSFSSHFKSQLAFA